MTAFHMFSLVQRNQLVPHYMIGCNKHTQARSRLLPSRMQQTSTSPNEWPIAEYHGHVHPKQTPNKAKDLINPSTQSKLKNTHKPDISNMNNKTNKKPLENIQISIQIETSPAFLEAECVKEQFNSKFIKHAINSSNIYVIATDKQEKSIVGLLAFKNSHTKCKIYALCVSKSHRGKGIADMLIKTAEGAMNCNKSILDADTSEIFWRMHGYRREGESVVSRIGRKLNPRKLSDRVAMIKSIG